MQAIAEGRDPGDLTTIEDPAALDQVKLAIASDPLYGEAFNLRGLIYMRLSDLRQAEESFRRAVALNPRDSNAQHNYGWLLCQTGRHDESQRALDV